MREWERTRGLLGRANANHRLTHRSSTQLHRTDIYRNKALDEFRILQFRVLVMGRANAGKTLILQRVCDTTESPKIYQGGEEVRGTNFVCESDLTADQFKLEPSMNLCSPIIRVVHDSRGIESQIF